MKVVVSLRREENKRDEITFSFSSAHGFVCVWGWVVMLFENSIVYQCTGESHFFVVCFVWGAGIVSCGVCCWLVLVWPASSCLLVKY